MVHKNKPGEIQMIPVSRIEVLNPRERNHKVFEEVVANIKAVGLKKPITVTPKPGTDGAGDFLLVCGEGRLKAFKSLGESHIPALVIDVSADDAHIMGLAENIARFKPSPLEIYARIAEMCEKGYDQKTIAEKTGLVHSYVSGILTLLQKGEERLLVAIEKKRVPLNVALTIVKAGDENKDVQVALQEAYETGKLRGAPLKEARRMVEHRRVLGRTMASGTPRKKKEISTSTLLRTYQNEVDRQKLMVKKAQYVQHRLLFIIGALRELYADVNFETLLRAEGLDTLPKYLAERVWPEGAHS